MITWVKVFCETCNDFSFIDEIKIEGEGNNCGGDIICPWCKVVLLTIAANEPGIYKISKTPQNVIVNNYTINNYTTPQEFKAIP